MDNKDLVENTENTEVTAEETVEPEKLYTQEDLDRISNERVDRVVSKKIARQRDRDKREFQKEIEKYKELESIVNAGLGTSSVEEAASQMRSFYEGKGVTIPETHTAAINDSDTRVLAKHEADEVISLGIDEVIDEVERLAEIGAENMTQREKLVYQQLATYRMNSEKKKGLLEIGASEEVIGSDSFNDFASQFKENTPASKIYELYQKQNGAKTIEPAGSMINTTVEEKDFYTSEEVDKMTSADLDKPGVLEKVMASMSKW